MVEPDLRTETRSDRKRHLRWFAFVGSGLVLLWGAAAYVALPSVVRSAYEGTSWEIFNRLISGQAYQPVEAYLLRAARLATLGSFAVASALVAGLALIWWRREVTALWGRWVREGPSDALTTTVGLVASLGLVFGLFEAILAWTSHRAIGAIGLYTNPDVFWMAPLAQGTVFALGATGLFLVLGGRRHPVSTHLFVGLFTLVAAYSATRGARLGLAPLALGVLATGIAVQTARALGRRPRTRRFLAHASVPLALVLVATPLVYTEDRRFGEAFRPGPSAVDAPNIVLIVLDTVRGESLGFMGYEREVTPNLDALAREGVVFERAMATSPWTLPTHASLFTGRYTFETGVSWDGALDDRHQTLAERLADAGYERMAVVANNANAGRGTGLARGFNWYGDQDRSLKTVFESSYLSRHLASWAWARTRRRQTEFMRRYAPEINREFLAWLDGRDHDSPYFAFLNYLDAHAPYELYDEHTVGFSSDNRMPVFEATGELMAASSRTARNIDAYDSSIAYMDDHIGQLRSELASRGALENTVFIVTSDHGEHLGERGLVDHGNSLYAQLLLVPLVFHWPGHIPGDIRIDEPVSLREVTTTVTSLAGLAPSFPGESLERFWAAGAGEPSLVLSELGNTEGAGFADALEEFDVMRSVVEGGLHYIRTGVGREELYDLASDPRERTNLVRSPEYGVDLARLRRALEAFEN